MGTAWFVQRCAAQRSVESAIGSLLKTQFKYHLFKVETEPEAMKKEIKRKVLKGPSEKINIPRDWHFFSVPSQGYAKAAFESHRRLHRDIAYEVEN